MAHATATATMPAMAFEQVCRPLRAFGRAIALPELGQVLLRDVRAGAAVRVPL
jgi:hypothetical protein